MSESKAVYRSSHPDVLAHRDRIIRDTAAWKERVRAVLVELGFPADRDVWMNDCDVLGVMEVHGEPLPEGWRHDRKNHGVLLPARTKQPGKGYGKKLDALKQPNPRNGLPGGMPGRAFARTGLAFMHCGLQELGGAIYVTWSSELGEKEAEHIDPAVWERLKLSEFYAAIEATEGAVTP